MVTIKSKLNFGDEVTDKVSGFKGKIVAITQWQNGCLRLGVRPMVGKDGKLQEAEWIDEADLIFTKDIIQRGPAGPTPNPKNDPDPKY